MTLKQLNHSNTGIVTPNDSNYFNYNNQNIDQQTASYIYANQPKFPENTKANKNS